MLKQQMTDSCTQSIISCEQATRILLHMLSGKLGDQCDLVTALYERDLNFQLYRGLKGQYLSAVTYVFELATLGWGLHAATLSIKSNDPYSWVVA
jgi:hypothetical protein